MTSNSSRSWLGKLASLDGLDLFRLKPGIEILEGERFYWVRGPGAKRPLTVPWLEHYEVQAGMLSIPGHHLTCGQIPEGDWVSLGEYVKVEPPAAALPGLLTKKTPLTLVPSQEMRPPGMLVLTVSAWLSFVEGAPEIRLRGLEFALLESGRVYVRGTPLPAISGLHYVIRDGIATPAGLEIHPPLSAKTMRRLLDLNERDIALFFADASHLRIPFAAWQPAKRAVVREACAAA